MHCRNCAFGKLAKKFWFYPTQFVIDNKKRRFLLCFSFFWSLTYNWKNKRTKVFLLAVLLNTQSFLWYIVLTKPKFVRHQAILNECAGSVKSTLQKGPGWYVFLVTWLLYLNFEIICFNIICFFDWYFSGNSKEIIWIFNLASLDIMWNKKN